ncbi:MAG TPA: hypothetical protein VK636_22150 [Gemmatimonadaceae bacterium]|nr:hypothetical protein [Gemmatimonadaceae bacterium]
MSITSVPALRALATVLVLLATPHADGTYSITMSGAKRAHLTGHAAVKQSSRLSDAGPSYSIVLDLPKGTAPGDPSGQEFLLFSSTTRPSPGRHVAADPGAPSNDLGVLLTGDDQMPWSSAGGHVDLTSGKTGKNSWSGSFAIKFVRLQGLKRPIGPTDTLFVSGQFDVP